MWTTQSTFDRARATAQRTVKESNAGVWDSVRTDVDFSQHVVSYSRINERERGRHHGVSAFFDWKLFGAESVR